MNLSRRTMFAGMAAAAAAPSLPTTPLVPRSGMVLVASWDRVPTASEWMDARDAYNAKRRAQST